jgi:hypothetical protein
LTCSGFQPTSLPRWISTRRATSTLWAYSLGRSSSATCLK